MSEISAPAAPEASTESVSQNDTQPVEQKAPVPTKKKYSYKADGQDISEELDDSEVASRLSYAKAANKRMQEAATTKKQYENFIKELKENPLKIMNDDKIMGQAKFRQFAEEYLLEQIQAEQMSPEEREQDKRNRRLSELEAKEKESAAEAQSQKDKQLAAHWEKQFEQTIMTGLTESGLPKNAFTVKRMAELMQKNLQHGFDLDPSQLASMVKEDYMNEHKAMVSGLTPEQLIATFGEEVANKIRKHDLSKFQQKNPVPKAPSAEPVITRKLTPREYNEQLRAKFSGKG